MKIAIISDTHDNLENLKKFFNFSKKENANILIHCGDVCTRETLREIEKNFDRVYLSFGNADILESLLSLGDSEKIKFFENVGKTEIDNLKIGFCHFPTLAQEFFEKDNFDFFFFGHTHRPQWEEKEGKILANPGTLAGLYFKATFAILDTKTKNLELKILEKI
jgi:hypothetical protein